MATLDEGSTPPMTRTSRGTAFFVTRATVTGTAGVPPPRPPEAPPAVSVAADPPHATARQDRTEQPNRDRYDARIRTPYERGDDYETTTRPFLLRPATLEARPLRGAGF